MTPKLTRKNYKQWQLYYMTLWAILRHQEAPYFVQAYNDLVEIGKPLCEQNKAYVMEDIDLAISEYNKPNSLGFSPLLTRIEMAIVTNANSEGVFDENKWFWWRKRLKNFEKKLIEKYENDDTFSN